VTKLIIFFLPVIFEDFIVHFNINHFHLIYLEAPQFIILFV